MQKKIIALAVAGLVSGAAFAQSNVTIYGIADAAYVYSKSDDNKFSGIDSGGWSGGRIGFRGEEALGNGLKAIFTYEFGSNIDENSAFNRTRQAFVGLSGGFGSVTLGRQYAPSFLYLGATSANDITGVNPVDLALGSYFVTMQTGDGSRWNNSVAYNSPNWSGLDFRVIYGFGESVGHRITSEPTITIPSTPGEYPLEDIVGTDETDHGTYDTSDSGRFGLGVRYANGPLYLTAIYQQSEESFNDVEDGTKAWAIGGNYDFKVVKVFANYVHQKYDDGDKQNLFSIGLGVPVSKAGTVHFEYMQFKDKSFDDENKAKGFGVGYYHDLSKRTRLYANVSQIDNDDNVKWGFSKTIIAGEKNTNLQLGIRHAF
ncbi:MAG: porin [Candidatus Accumulibacter sp.]|jgi:predicted porin|nr:porin [Accumulibacter sp.]